MLRNFFKLKILYLICFGALIGALSAFSLSTFLVLGLSIYIIHICRKNTIISEEKEFITYACVLAIGIRIIISLFILGYGRYSEVGSDIFGDAMTYEGIGAYIKELISGVPIRTGLWGDNLMAVHWLRQMWPSIDNSQLGGLFTVPGLSYWYGYFNILWGSSFLAAKILNGLMWIIGSFFLYLFFRDRFTNNGTKFGLSIILFLPSSLIFSSSGLKDSLLFLLIVMIIFSSHRLERSNHRWYAAFALLITVLLTIFPFSIDITRDVTRISFFIISLFIISIIIVTFNAKYWLFWGLLIVTSGLLLPILRQYVNFSVLIFSFFILVKKINFKKVFVVIIPIVIFALIIFRGGFRDDLYNRFRARLRHTISELVLQSYNTYGNNAYYVFPKRFYVNIETRDTITYPEVFFSYLNGLRYVFLEPTPCSFKTLLAVIMFPETLFMWFFAPFIILGIVVILRINTRMALATILFLFLLTSLLALCQGNMGTLIRIRSMIMPWYFMIGGLGLGAIFPKFSR